MHHEHVRLALEAGKPVLVEKPMALNHAQAAEMVALARAKKLFFAEALWSFFLPKLDVLQQIFEFGALGEIKSVYTEYGEYLPREHRIFDARLAGGPLLDLGTYPVSLLAKLLGVPREVVGLGAAGSERRERSTVGRHAQRIGSLGVMSTTFYGFTPTNAAIVGTQGTVRFPTEFHLPGSFEVRSLRGRDSAEI